MVKDAECLTKCIHVNEGDSVGMCAFASQLCIHNYDYSQSRMLVACDILLQLSGSVDAS